MLAFEDLLERLQAEGLSLETADKVQDPEARHALKGKVNQAAAEKFAAVREYLKPYPMMVITDECFAERMAQSLSEQRGAIGIDIETLKLKDHQLAGLHPRLSAVRLVQLFDGKYIYIVDQLNMASLDWICPLKDTKLIAHNSVFEAQHFHHAGIEFSDLHCTMQMGRVFLNRNYSLAKLAKDTFGLDVDKKLQVSRWDREVLLAEQIRYAALDAVLAYQAAVEFEAEFQTYPHYRDTYEHLRSLVYPMVRQLEVGIVFDTVEHARIVAEWQSRLSEIAKQLAQDGLTEPTKVKAKQEYLRQKLSEEELEFWPKTRTKNLSTDKDALASLENHPTLGLLGEFNLLSSRLGNFGDKLTGMLIGGKLYPGYQIAGMVTGRYGSSGPNMQNQPREGFKHVYLAPEGHSFVTGDLAQVELRVAGLISEDKVILGKYEQGLDLHRYMAAQMARKPESEVTKHERTGAKGVNFGLLFGQGARGLVEYVRKTYKVEMTLAEAALAKAAFEKAYPDLRLWQKAIVRHTNKYDESETVHSRLTRHYSGADHYRSGEYRDIYSHSMNFPIQGTAAEILQLAIIYADQHASEGIRVSHHVYDELCLVCPDEKVMEAAYLLRDSFRYGYRTVFPGCNVTGIIEVGAGKNWAEAASDDNIIELDDAERAA
jgi:DNA polymerase I-like protein with 3'-5' exonuclease and polymerase domains